jgi:hypothetical protein
MSNNILALLEIQYFIPAGKKFTNGLFADGKFLGFETVSCMDTLPADVPRLRAMAQVPSSYYTYPIYHDSIDPFRYSDNWAVTWGALRPKFTELLFIARQQNEFVRVLGYLEMMYLLAMLSPELVSRYPKMRNVLVIKMKVSNEMFKKYNIPRSTIFYKFDAFLLVIKSRKDYVPDVPAPAVKPDVRAAWTLPEYVPASRCVDNDRSCVKTKTAVPAKHTYNLRPRKQRA